MISPSDDYSPRSHTPRPAENISFNEFKAGLGLRAIRELDQTLNTDPGARHLASLFVNFIDGELPHALAAFDVPLDEHEVCAMRITVQAKTYRYLLTAEGRAEAMALIEQQLEKQLLSGEAQDPGTQIVKLKELLKAVPDLPEQRIDELVSKFEDFHMFNATVNEEMARKLFVKSKNEGIEAATSQEAKYEILREQYPTAESYTSFIKETMTRAPEIFREIAGELKKYDPEALPGTDILDWAAGAFERLGNSAFFQQLIARQLKKMYPA